MREEHRNIYIKCFGKISKKYDVHHIDHDHYNNSPINLVAIPQNLHQRYHELYNRLKVYNPCTIIQNKRYYVDELKKFEKLYEEIMMYANNKYEEE